MTDLRLLEYLRAFYKAGTLSAAAEAQHTSQPALTRAMKRLEEELGTELFIRSKNRLSLNETGMHAAEYALSALSAAKDFTDKVKAFDRSLRTISIGYCAPVPQTVLTPILNNLFGGMTISADMSDDSSFCSRLQSRDYQLAVMHKSPEDNDFFSKKCGHEDLFVSVVPGDPLSFYPSLHLEDLDGLSVLLLSRIGFWTNMHREKTPNTHYLVQIDQAAFDELAQSSSYPVFSSSYYLRSGIQIPGRINIPIIDPECHTDFYLVCLESEKHRFLKLFDAVNDQTIW